MERLCGQVLLCCMWVLVGVMVVPYKLLPYATCLLCFAVGGSSAYAKERRSEWWSRPEGSAAVPRDQARGERCCSA